MRRRIGNLAGMRARVRAHIFSARSTIGPRLQGEQLGDAAHRDECRPDSAGCAFDIFRFWRHKWFGNLWADFRVWRIPAWPAVRRLQRLRAGALWRRWWRTRFEI